MRTINKINILNVGITNASQSEVLEYIVENLENSERKRFVVTPNPEFLVLASKNNAFKNILNKADLALADGVGVVIAAKILGKPLKERFAGVDLVKTLCEMVAEKPITVGFLGGKDGVAERAAECLQKMSPNLKIAFVGEEWSSGLNRQINNTSEPGKNASLECDNKTSASAAILAEDKSKEKIKSSACKESSLSNSTVKLLDNGKVDVLFVAFGCPKQEFWIYENLEKIPVKIAIGVGGTFDYISGKVPRAPKFIRAIGFEWLFRLIIQPWRIKRQLALLKFIYLVVKEGVIR